MSEFIYERVHVLSGETDADDVRHGMLIKFDQPVRSVAEPDSISVSTPSGKQISLHVVEATEETIVVAARINTHASLHFRLEKVDDFTRRLEMEPHHIEFFQSRKHSA